MEIKEPRTNWLRCALVFCGLLAIAAVVIFSSQELREAGTLLLTLFGICALIGAAVVEAIFGSIARRRYDLLIKFAQTTQCATCGASDRKLHLIDYEWILFLYLYARSSMVAGKFCEPCARRLVNRMFIMSIFGCILCPPIILWPAIKRHRILAKYARDHEPYHSA
jgi:hypothetical protein